jgi:chemotaxis protein CheD
MPDTMVRMGEYAYSAGVGDVLVSLGLGSCVGVALIDRRASVAGLAHVVLPSAEGREDAPGKFADTAVPALLDAVVALGARRTRVDAVLVGGASMFSFSGAGLDIGERNDAAVREELARLRIPVAAAETGGSTGRTVRVDVETGVVTAKAAGNTEVELYPKALVGAAA